MENDFELLRNLRNKVETELEQYVYRVLPEAIGNAMSNEAVSAGLKALREAVVEPYWTDVEVRDTFAQVASAQGPRRRCVVVADDCRRIFLLWDPIHNDFFLAENIAGVLTSFGVRGDAVGCFLSR